MRLSLRLILPGNSDPARFSIFTSFTSEVTAWRLRNQLGSFSFKFHIQSQHFAVSNQLKRQHLRAKIRMPYLQAIFSQRYPVELIIAPVGSGDTRAHSLELGRLDVGLGAEPERDRKRHEMAARRNVVVVHREGEVVRLAFLQRLVVGVGEVQRASPYDGPRAVLPHALDLLVVRGRSCCVCAADY